MAEAHRRLSTFNLLTSRTDLSCWCMTDTHHVYSQKISAVNYYKTVVAKAPFIHSTDSEATQKWRVYSSTFSKLRDKYKNARIKEEDSTAVWTSSWNYGAWHHPNKPHYLCPPTLVLPKFSLKAQNQYLKHFGTATGKKALATVLKAIKVKIQFFITWPPFSRKVENKQISPLCCGY